MGEIKNSFSVQCRNANIAKERFKKTMLKEIKTDMKKLLNKLFEWLGYKLLSKKEYDSMNEGTYRMQKRYLMAINDNIESGIYSFKIIEGSDCFYIGFIFSRVDFLSIKSFPFGDDKEYARLCAEELCEKLNEKI